MVRLAKGMDPLGLSEPSDSDGDDDDSETEEKATSKMTEPRKQKQLDFETLSQFGYKR